MPDHARLAQVEREDARLAAPAATGERAGAEPELAIAIAPLLAGLGAGLGTGGGPGDGGGPGGPAPIVLSRSLNPAALLTLQRLAGNRATAVAIRRIQRQPAASATTDEEDQPAAAEDGIEDVDLERPIEGIGGAAAPAGTPPPATVPTVTPKSAPLPEITPLPLPVPPGSPGPGSGSGPGSGPGPADSPADDQASPGPDGAETGPSNAPTPGPGGPAPGVGIDTGLGPSVPATAGPVGMPDPESAKTGIDWNQLLSDFGAPTRTVLEIGRLVPGWGLLAGLGADSINFAQDLAAIPNSQNAELTTVLVVFRNFVNIGNNAVGHVLYVNQLIQDGLAGSVVGAEFTPLTAAVNEALSSLKVTLDSVQLGTDIVIEVEALYQSNHAPTSGEAEQWKAFADNYAGNILGDIVNLTLDVISLASAGAANTAVVQEARLPLTLAGAFMKKATPNIISAVNNVLGVWLGSLLTEGRQAYEGSPEQLRDRALAWDVAGGFVDVEAGRAKLAYAGINLVIDQLAEYADQQVSQMDAVVEALTGGKSTFELIRDSVNQGLQDMSRKLGMVEQLGSMASDARTNSQAISEACAMILGALDRLVVPDVELPEIEVGDGIIADAAEAIANEARAAANSLIRRTVARVNVRIDQITGEVRGPVEAVQERADSIGEWLALLAAECEAMASTLNNYITQFSDGLARCTNAEQVIDLIIGQISDLTGMPRITVQEIREAWQSVGGSIDRFAQLGPRMHQRAADLRTHADLLEAGGALGPTLAAPPEPPPGLPPGMPPPPGASSPPTAAVA